MTLQQALREARRRVNSSPLPCDPNAPALLLCDILGIDRAHLLGEYASPLPHAAFLRFQRALDRLLAGEPLQYVLGHWAFYGREFRCDPRALIPREDTETLLQAALAQMPAQPQRVVDLGCGTGCIAVTWQLERPQDDVYMVDISRDALDLAQENAALLGARVTACLQDMRSPLPRQDYTVMVSNPPYIAQDELDQMDRSVLEHEPHLALFAGEDDLQFYRALCLRAEQSLLGGGLLAVECGYRQAQRVAQLFAPLCSGVHICCDAAGTERVVWGRKKI